MKSYILRTAHEFIQIREETECLALQRADTFLRSKRFFLPSGLISVFATLDYQACPERFWIEMVNQNPVRVFHLGSGFDTPISSLDDLTGVLPSKSRLLLNGRKSSFRFLCLETLEDKAPLQEAGSIAQWNSKFEMRLLKEFHRFCAFSGQVLSLNHHDEL